MPGERHTRIRASQIISVLPDDLDSTNAIGSGLDNYVPSYDVDTGKFTWVLNAGGSSNISDLSDVDFDSGTPTDNQILTYDSSSGKWKAEDRIYRTTFTNADLSAGVLTVTHNLGQQICFVQIYDNSNNQIIPDEITLTNSSSCSVDLTTFGTLTGTWNIIVIG